MAVSSGAVAEGAPAGTFSANSVESYFSPSTARSPIPPPPNRVYESMYEKLGRWVGRDASQQAKEAVLRSWVRSGEDGAFWLVRQVVKERNLDALDGASNALMAMGSLAAPYMIAALEESIMSGDTESTMKLLRILEWFSATDLAPLAGSLTRILERVSVLDQSPELREAAYRCIPLLPNHVEVRACALAKEPDPELRSILEEQQG